jgi:exopolyphosphatase/guanosine-5'-triphosphate,3'-diphosphate pyrophosphatase
MKSLHGMGRREKLLLRPASRLQDCGKYINMMNVGVCSYSIIENTEIIGISHRERMMVASIVKYIHEPFEYYREMTEHVDIDKESYLKNTKLTAILQLANALDKGKKEKIKKISATLVDGELKINIDSRQDFLFEQERFKNKALFFEEIYGIRPVIVRT